MKEIGMNKGINTVGDGSNGYPITPIRLKKEWVGLTDEEIWQWVKENTALTEESGIRIVRAIETKLKEKNGG